MTQTAKTQRHIPTVQEVTARQEADHAPGGIASPSTALVPRAGTDIAVPDAQDSINEYLDEIAPATLVGRLIKFSKGGKFVTADDEQPIKEDAQFTALCDQTLVGWIKFNGKGVPPSRDQGLLYGGFRKRELDTLPDRDKSKWAIGLNGEPEDPWKHQMCLVLQGVDDMQLYTFATVNKTGRRACGDLLRHYDRVCCRTNPGEYPIVQLRPGVTSTGTSESAGSPPRGLSLSARRSSRARRLPPT
jgi:hypothetical protein